VDRPDVDHLAHDEGDRLVIRPAPDDPVAATRGVFAPEFASGPTVAELMAERHRTQRPVPLADCVFLASTQPGGAVATLDAHLAAMARDEGVEVVDL
jgi:hypothetical protein